MHRYKSTQPLKKQSREAAFETYFKAHYGSLCKGVYRLIKDTALAEDLVQEVFLKVWEKRNSLTLDDRFIFYLKKSCYHAALNYLTYQKKLHILDDELEAKATDRADQDLIHSQLEDDVRKAIANLPEKTQIVFVLSRYESMTYKEIASELNVSVKAVEKHISIALSRLRELLRDYLPCLFTFFSFFS